MSGEFSGFWIGVATTTIVCAFLPNTKVNSVEWDWAVLQCAPNGGFADMAGEGFIRSAKVTCKNGASFVKRKIDEP